MLWKILHASPELLIKKKSHQKACSYEIVKSLYPQQQQKHNNKKLLGYTACWRANFLDKRISEILPLYKKHEIVFWNIPDRLLQYYLQQSTVQTNKKLKRHQGYYTQTPEMDRTCADDGTGSHPKGAFKIETF